MFVKICGVTTTGDAELAASLGVGAVGMIFAASPRRVTHGAARAIAGGLPPEVLSVGVFRNEHRDRVAEIADAVGLRAVQLHGHESPEDAAWLAERVPVVIKVFSTDDPALALADRYEGAWLLIDTPGGGTGRRFDWSTLSRVPAGRPYILAGGLDPDNVAEAVRTVAPWGVDVATGVEASPGHKDPLKLRRFVAAVREATAAAGAAGAAATLAGSAGDQPLNWEEDGTWR